MHVGLTSVGGAAGPLRHVAVKSRRWLDERDLAELFGIGQALPGANVANVGIMLGDRSAGIPGALAALAGLCLPSLAVALTLATFATHLAATNARFAAAEVGVTAGVAGIFLSNGARVIALVWRDGATGGAGRGVARLALSALGVVLVAWLHVWVPLVVVGLVGASLALETSARGETA
jgi:chromate transporter